MPRRACRPHRSAGPRALRPASPAKLGELRVRAGHHDLVAGLEALRRRQRGEDVAAATQQQRADAVAAGQVELAEWAPDPGARNAHPLHPVAGPDLEVLEHIRLADGTGDLHAHLALGEDDTVSTDASQDVAVQP